MPHLHSMHIVAIRVQPVTVADASVSTASTELPRSPRSFARPLLQLKAKARPSVAGTLNSYG